MRISDWSSDVCSSDLTATGFLSQPKMPDIPGIESFAGKVIHSAKWDHEYDLRGKKAALIGTGATAVQLVPEVAKQVRSEERRVGKECVSTGRSRGSADH